jgi:outer membrane lipoprotein-sorting protein
MEFRRLAALTSAAFTTAALTTAALALPGGAAAALDEKTDPKQALLDAYHGVVKLKSYRIISTTTAKTTSTTVLEYQAPDHFRMVTDRAETVVTPGATYVKYKGGRWAMAPVDVSELIARFREPKELKEIETSQDFRLLGPETVNGTPTLVYQYVTVVDGQRTVSKAWLMAGRGLPVKKESTSEYASEKVSSVLDYDYDRDITIDPPIHG